MPNNSLSGQIFGRVFPPKPLGMAKFSLSHSFVADISRSRYDSGFLSFSVRSDGVFLFLSYYCTISTNRSWYVMVCYMLPNLFTGHIVHGQLLPVTGRKFVHSYQILVRNHIKF